MTRLEWGTPGSREYETGVDRGVLYLDGQAGVAWPGLTSVDVAPEGGGAKSYYLDGEKYLLVSAREEFGATINAFTYPPQFSECDGSKTVRNGLSLKQQRRKSFGFSYRTQIGNDLNPDAGYKIHLIYNALAEPSGQSHNTTNDSLEPNPFSWSIKTKPPVVAGYRRTAHVVVDSRTTDPSVLTAVENLLYGDDVSSPRLPSFSELLTVYDTPNFALVVTDNGDGTFTITGPDNVVQQLSSTTYQITWSTVVAIDEDTYSVSS